MQPDCNRTKGNGFRLKQSRCRLDVRRKSCTQKVVQLCRLPGEVVDAPSLQLLKAGLDAALGSHSWWVAALRRTVGLEPVNL